jgi:hypothetical protein
MVAAHCFKSFAIFVLALVPKVHELRRGAAMGAVLQ